MVAIDAGSGIPPEFFATVKAVNLNDRTGAIRFLFARDEPTERLRSRSMSDRPRNARQHQGSDHETTKNLEHFGLLAPCRLDSEIVANGPFESYRKGQIGVRMGQAVAALPTHIPHCPYKARPKTLWAGAANEQKARAPAPGT
jgi:hypothetical protein